MPYKKEDLEKVNLHELRKLGREIGVKCPSAKIKKELINDIFLISNGKMLPHKNNNGRPVLQVKIEKENSLPLKEKLTEEKLDELLKKLKQEILALL